MKVKVSKVSLNKNTYNSELDALDMMPYRPQKGQSLYLGSSTDPLSGIVTSLVENVEYDPHNMVYTIKTINSTYQVEVLTGMQ